MIYNLAPHIGVILEVVLIVSILGVIGYSIPNIIGPRDTCQQVPQ